MSFWEREVDLYNKSNLSAGKPLAPPRFVGLADDILQMHTGQAEFMLNHMERAQVVILNWDVINGDPSFGADLASRWVEHYQHNFRAWVRRGGILVLEGQANLSIPVQRAYDAVLGEGEVRLSGMEDPLDVTAQNRRVGQRCCLTRQALSSELFRSLHGYTLAPAERNYDDYFPDANAKSPLDPDLKTGPRRRWQDANLQVPIARPQEPSLRHQPDRCRARWRAMPDQEEAGTPQART